MRHNKKINHLGRKSAHRKALLSNLAISLIMHKRIETTTAKAKELKRFIEPLVTKAKVDSTHSRRIIFSYLQDKDSVTELFRTISPKIADRPGGYTRILKIGNRLGDNAEMCFIELVDFNESYSNAKSDTKNKKRSRRAGKKGTEDAKIIETSPKAEKEVVAVAPESAASETVEPALEESSKEESEEA